VKLIRLQAFKEVMESGTVTEASHRLKCSQPRVSRLIAELEEEIGFPLFRREKQRLQATKEGHEFFNETQRILQGINNIEQIAEDIYNERETCLRVLSQSHIAHGLLSRVIGEFDKIEKNIRFHLEIRPREQLAKWLGGHQFDLAFTVLPARHPLVRHEKLTTVNLLVALPNKTPFADKAHISIEDLSTLPIIALPRGLPMRSRLHELFDNSGFNPMIRIETPTSLSACQLVSRNLGAALTDPFIASLFPKDSFIIRPVFPEYKIDYGVLFLKQEQPRRLVRHFVDIARNVTQSINSEVAERLSC
jgi:DNA-binding transcriptional LysR family regulator